MSIISVLVVGGSENMESSGSKLSDFGLDVVLELAVVVV